MATNKTGEKTENMAMDSEIEAETAKIGAAETETVGVGKTSEQDPKEMVEIYLFLDGEKYKDDVFVAVNGKTFQIKRGETVKVPRYVKEVLDNSAKQNKVANRYMEKQQEIFEREAQKI